jgi:hypothetical protein
MKYLKTFEELTPEERAKLSNSPHKQKEEFEKREKRIQKSYKEDPDGMYPRDDKKYDSDGSKGGWQDGMGKPSWLSEGATEKAAKRKDKNLEVNPDKMDSMRKKVKDHVESQGCETKQVGDDFEVHLDGEHIAQIMFRKDYIGVKKVGNKFPKEFEYTELGKIKSELSDIIKYNK